MSKQKPIRIDEKQHAELQQISSDTKVPIAALVRDAVDKYLEWRKRRTEAKKQALEALYDD